MVQRDAVQILKPRQAFNAGNRVLCAVDGGKRAVLGEGGQGRDLIVGEIQSFQRSKLIVSIDAGNGVVGDVQLNKLLAGRQIGGRADLVVRQIKACQFG